RRATSKPRPQKVVARAAVHRTRQSGNKSQRRPSRARTATKPLHTQSGTFRDQAPPARAAARSDAWAQSPTSSCGRAILIRAVAILVDDTRGLAQAKQPEQADQAKPTPVEPTPFIVMGHSSISRCRIVRAGCCGIVRVRSWIARAGWCGIARVGVLLRMHGGNGQYADQKASSR